MESFLVCAVEIEDFENPNKDQKNFKFNMTPKWEFIYSKKLCKWSNEFN